MINIAVCDDEAYMQNELCDKITLFFKGECTSIEIRRFDSGTSLLHCNEAFDLIFLDIQMEGIGGMETAMKLRRTGYRGFLIFVTVLTDPVFDSFEVQAYDYFVKPLNSQRFNQTMKRFLSAFSQKNRRLLVKYRNDQILIPMENILFCEIINRKITIHLTDRETITYYEKLENLEQTLDSRFFRCHRSYLINLAHLRTIKNGLAYLGNADTVPVSRLRNQALSEAVLKYLETGGRSRYE